MNSVSLKILLGYVAILIASLLTASLLYNTTFEVNKGVDEFIEQTLPELNHIKTIDTTINKIVINAYAFYGFTIEADNFNKNIETYQNLLNEVFLNFRKQHRQFSESTQSEISQLQKLNQQLFTQLNAESKDWDKAREILKQISHQSKKVHSNLSEFQQSIEQNSLKTSEKIQQEVDSSLWLIIILALTIVIISFIAYYLGKIYIANPINQMSLTLQNSARDYDLVNVVTFQSKDEIGQASSSINNLFSTFRESLIHVFSASSEVNDLITQLKDSVKNSNHHIEALNEETQKVVIEMEKLETDIIYGANRSLSTADNAKKNANEVENGVLAVDNTSMCINQLAQDIKESSVMLSSLQEAGAKISGVVGTIDEIAEQTNLLALNAAIEAARAGESGRGFAVVADEVRMLATKTSNSTREIQTMLENIVTIISNSVDAMEKNSNKASESVDLAQKTIDALFEIKSNILSLSQESHEVADSSEQIRNKVVTLKSNINNFNQIGTEVNNSSNTNLSISENLSQLALNLQQLVKKFRI